jgi:hypothetical protein
MKKGRKEVEGGVRRRGREEERKEGRKEVAGRTGGSKQGKTLKEGMKGKKE